ncbi:MAG: hypothetical protein DHS20C18_12690 [Saprospiraceae bacterium]|nr:MAG: hypothetical protein DHS20C18_12690 [Saprospiraceae bacterium]
MARRIKKQKKADETLVDIVEVRDQAQDFFEDNQKLIMGALAAIVILVGGWFVYKNFYQAPKEREAIEQMFQAQLQFERDSFALALTNPGGAYSGFLDIASTYGGTTAGNLANYYAGISYLNLGKFDAAIEYLKDYSPAGEITPVMKNGALGDAYSESGDFATALSYYDKAANASDNELLSAYYLKKLGMLHEKQGDFSKAKAAYQKVKDNFPKSPYAADIEKYLIRVSQKG